MKKFEKVLEFEMPARLRKSKNKWFYFNLNQYRNAHHRVLSNVKNALHDYIAKLNLKSHLGRTIESPVYIHYIYHPLSNRVYDRMNVVSVADKFLCDALIDCGVIKDDNYKLMYMPTMDHGAPDKENPHFKVQVFEEVDALNPPACWKD